MDNNPTRADNRNRMSQPARQRRILRAEALASQCPASAGMLHFLVHVLRFQDELQIQLEQVLKNGGRKASFAGALPETATKFSAFLKMVEKNGSSALARRAEELGISGNGEFGELLHAFWNRPETTTALPGEQEFFVRAFLQPYAELVRSRAGKQRTEWTPRLCPYCLRKPGSGVLRPAGNGGQRFLLCSFCLAEWEFRRIVCAGCGEENERKLPVYTAEEFTHVRVECCDSCQTYIKTVDLTRDGLADPMIDEIAAIPLDLWAQEQGYSKLQTNLMLM